MKGKISLTQFLHDVADELSAARRPIDEAFYELCDVELEVSFALEATAGAKAQFVVLELGGETKGLQTHKVTLKLKPFKHTSAEVDPAGKSSGGVDRPKKFPWEKPNVYGNIELLLQRYRFNPGVRPKSSVPVLARGYLHK